MCLFWPVSGLNAPLVYKLGFSHRAAARRHAADPQSGHARWERRSGHPLLVLPLRMAVLPGGREHLLCGSPARDEPRACDHRHESLRGGESVRHGSGARRAGRAHATFGQGVHSCLGSMLVRLEAKCTVEAICEMFSSVRPGKHPFVRQTATQLSYALDACPVIFEV